LSQSALALLAVGGVVLLAGCARGANKSGGAQEQHVTVLKLANINGEIEPSLQRYVNAVHRLSHGTLRIDVGLNHRLGDPRAETDTIRDVQSGRAQLAWVGARAWDTVGVDSFRALVAPFLIDSYPLEQQVLSTRPISAELLASLRPLGLVGLAVLPGPFRRVASRRPLLQPAQLAGVTFAATPTGVARATVRALGARPVVEIPNQAVQQLPRDVGAVESQFFTIYGNQYFRKFHYLTRNLDLWPRPLVVFANRKVFDALSSAQQQALRLAGRAALAKATIASRAVDDGIGGAVSLCRVGMHEVVATPADLAAFRRAVAPVYTLLDRDPRTRSLIARIESLKRRLAVPPDSGPPCAAQPSGRGKSTTLDGVYRMSGTLAQLAQLDHVPPSTEPPANYGTYVMVFDRGHFAFTQQSESACTWGYGTFTVSGRRTAWKFIDGGGGPGVQAVNKPGEFFRYGWSLYRGTLTLTPVAGAISPTNFRITPWRLMSRTPTAADFRKLCGLPKGALPGLR
jgi:TRAP-type C4-dicarboxylate transport system substrate-binding protein